MLQFSLKQAQFYIERNCLDSERITELIHQQIKITGLKKFRQKAAEELIQATRPDALIPDVYNDFRPIVRDGLHFLFTHLKPDRLIHIIASQLMLDKEAGPEERITALARHIPTLHKLGQIIARNRHIPSRFRNWLIHLENRIQDQDVRPIHERLRQSLGDAFDQHSIQLGDHLLAEASVGAVVGFTWKKMPGEPPIQGVLKVVKPGVRQKLAEEFGILEELASWFDAGRFRYAMKDFRFIDTFRDIKEALQEEIHLEGEQAHLEKAGGYFASDPVKIPRLLPFCSDTVTAMKRIAGEKITDAHMTAEERQACAEILFETLIWQPLFSKEEKTLFHGDPHAGNIFAERDTDGSIRPVLLDWSLTGELSQRQRMQMIRLVLSILTNDFPLICQAAASLSTEKEEAAVCLRIEMMVHEIMAEPEYRQCRHLEKAFFFIDRTAFRGIHYPKELLLFRKAFFTLEGVLQTLDPQFHMDACMFRLIGSLMREEASGRMLYALMPHWETAGHYKTLMTNRELHQRLMKLILTQWNSRTADMLSVVTRQFQYFWFPASWNFNMKNT